MAARDTFSLSTAGYLLCGADLIQSTNPIYYKTSNIVVAGRSGCPFTEQLQAKRKRDSDCLTVPLPPRDVKGVTDGGTP